MKKIKTFPKMKKIETHPKSYCMLKNDIVLALAKTRLSSYESSVLFAIIRKTYGFIEKDGSRKTMDWISLSQMRELTGIRESHLCRTIKLLILRGIITKGGNKIGINKNISSWVKLPKGVNTHHLPKGVIGITKGGNSLLPKGGDTKETLTKETIQKKVHVDKQRVPVKEWKRKSEEKRSLYDRIVYLLEDTLHTKIVNWGKQNKAINKMLGAGYTEEQIKRTITYMATKDDFFFNKGFDLMTVSNQISRYKAEFSKNNKGG